MPQTFRLFLIFPGILWFLSGDVRQCLDRGISPGDVNCPGDIAQNKVVPRNLVSDKDEAGRLTNPTLVGEWWRRPNLLDHLAGVSHLGKFYLN